MWSEKSLPNEDGGLQEETFAEVTNQFPGREPQCAIPYAVSVRVSRASRQADGKRPHSSGVCSSLSYLDSASNLEPTWLANVFRVESYQTSGQNRSPPQIPDDLALIGAIHNWEAPNIKAQ